MPLAMRRGGAEILHGPANGLPLVRFGVPGVVTIHDLAIYDHPEWFPSRQWLSTRILVPRSARGARLVICPSEATRRAVVTHLRVPIERCRVIPHGVETHFRVRVDGARREEVRRRLQLPDRFLLQVGTIQPRKNYLASIRALALLPEAERIPLVIAGDLGWKFRPVLQEIEVLGLSRWVQHTGYVGMSDLPALYQMATVALFPSLDEGFGLPILEAFAAGVPVVASNAGAIPEVAGHAALMCPPNDAAGFATSVLTLLRHEDERERLVEEGRTRAAAYTWEASAAAHLHVYLEAARSPGSGTPS